MEKMRFLVPPGSVCRRGFAGFLTVLLDVKSLVEHVVVYYIYVTSGSSLLIVYRLYDIPCEATTSILHDPDTRKHYKFTALCSRHGCT